jgi:hypothetical protein
VRSRRAATIAAAVAGRVAAARIRKRSPGASRAVPERARVTPKAATQPTRRPSSPQRQTEYAAGVVPGGVLVRFTD